MAVTIITRLYFFNLYIMYKIWYAAKSTDKNTIINDLKFVYANILLRIS